MKIERFIAGQTDCEACSALMEMMRGHDIGKTYADMMRLRIDGGAAHECHDVYYVATENGCAIGRHWMGWGSHPNAVGNWGNFYTDEAFRGKGVGGALLRAWQDDLLSPDHTPLPSAFFCSAGTSELAALYARFGFRPAIKGRDCGPLYMPLGDSPEDFESFCERYYEPSQVICRRPATIGWRHEIDCLLRFYLINNGLEFGIGETKSLEEVLLSSPERAELFFGESGRCVGWAVGGKIQIHPKYINSKVI